MHSSQIGLGDLIKFTRSSPAGWTLEIETEYGAYDCLDTEVNFISVVLWGPDDDRDYYGSVGSDTGVEVCFEDFGTHSGDRTEGTLSGEMENDTGRVISISGDFEAKFAESVF